MGCLKRWHIAPAQWRDAMNIAIQLHYVMEYIWGDDEPEHSAVTKALASHIRTHGRRNHENVFDVIDILFPDQIETIVQRVNEDKSPIDYVIDVQFKDKSQCLVICRNGIGIGLEYC